MPALIQIASLYLASFARTAITELDLEAISELEVKGILPMLKGWSLFQHLISFSMGNRFARCRPVVDDKYTQPQGLYEHIGLDTRKLKRLIIKGQLAPCFPGVEDPSADLDECPICFLSYPSLNRSKCCNKAICTECFLQIKALHPARFVQCPFCKITNYGVEYPGLKSLEEKSMEQAEEQNVIEAKIRIRQRELHEDEEWILRRDNSQQSGDGEDMEARTVRDHQDSFVPTQPNWESQSQDFLIERENGSELDGEATISSHAAESHGSSIYQLNRGNFDFDLEDIMLMEAIWLSIQDQDQSQQGAVLDWKIRGSGNSSSRNANFTVDGTMRSTSERTNMGVTGSLAGAIAVLAERQANMFERNLRISQVSETTNISICGPINSVIAAQKSFEISKCSGNNLLNSVIANEATAGSPPNSVTRSRTMKMKKEGHIQCNTDSVNKYEERENDQAKLETTKVLNNWTRLTVGREDSKGSISGWSRTLLPLRRRDSKVSTSECHNSEAVQLETVDQPSSSTSLSPIVPDSFQEQIMLALALSLADAQKHS